MSATVIVLACAFVVGILILATRASPGEPPPDPRHFWPPDWGFEAPPADPERAPESESPGSHGPRGGD